MNDKGIPYIGELMSNLNIDEVLWDAYYNLTFQPTSREKISKSYVGRLNWYNNPFLYNVYDSYPLRHDYELLIAKIDDGYFERKNINKDEIDYYLKEYSKGFKFGHDNFEKDIVKAKSSLFDEKEDYSRSIFDFATGSLFKGSGFPECYGFDKHILSGWYDAGIQGGYFYRSWYLMLNHSDRFLKYFSKVKNDQEDSFVNHIIRGIYCLQKLDNKAICIKRLRENKKNENEFRDWFIPWFEAIYDFVNSEPEKGSRRIDLKIEDNKIGTKIIEFKGWWNPDKKEVVDQLTNYMTEFDKRGYIVMINHLTQGKRGEILDKYRQLISSEKLNFCTWEEYPYKDSDFKYYKSTHKCYGKTKEIYHFLYRLNK